MKNIFNLKNYLKYFLNNNQFMTSSKYFNYHYSILNMMKLA